jgi:hypothetical protein
VFINSVPEFTFRHDYSISVLNLLTKITRVGRFYQNYLCMKKNLFLWLAVLLVFSACSHPKEDENLPKIGDYSVSSNWLHVPSSATQEVDVFYVYPTVISSEAEYCELDDPEMRTEAQKLYEAYNGIFANCNFYAPFYHQLSLNAFVKETTAQGTEALIERIPLRDCKAAFEYFLKHHNNNRPIIFASHSQGTMILKQLLLWIRTEHPEVLDRMIAAYMIGYAINQDYLTKVNLPFAEGRTDTGVIICYNTEAPDAEPSPFTMRLYKNCLAINPINWQRDETYASTEESLGTRLRPEDTDGTHYEDKPHFADAKVNLTRGTVVTNAPVSSGTIWPKGCLHHYDFDLFYYDLKQNVEDRITAYKK